MKIILQDQTYAITDDDPVLQTELLKYPWIVQNNCVRCASANPTTLGRFVYAYYNPTVKLTRNKIISFIDNDPYNCTISNLKLINMVKKPDLKPKKVYKNSKSKIKGLCWRRNSWRIRIIKDGKIIERASQDLDMAMRIYNEIKFGVDPKILTSLI
jgi:hypothetical protein